MRQVNLFIVYLLTFLTLLTSCNVKRYIPASEKLYEGGSVKLKPLTKVTGRRTVQSELDELMKPKPNSKILGARFGLWAHYRAQRESPSKFTKWLNKKYGEKPVYLSSIDTTQTIKLIKNRLENRGFFFSYIKVELKLHKHIGEVSYVASVTAPYVLKQLIYPVDSTSNLSIEIGNSLKRGTQKPGVRYDLQALKDARVRIDEYLKNHGYYDFRPDNLIFKVDTNQSQTRQFELFLSIKEEAPKESLIPYKIRSVKVYTDYSVQEDREVFKGDSSTQDSIVIIQGPKYFKYWHVPRYVLLRPGDVYSQRKQNNTVTRFSTIGTFRFVNIRFTKSDSMVTDKNGYGYLDTDIYLSTFSSQAVRAELQALSKSNNFVGPELILNYKHRSIFKSGELLALTTKFGYETQYISGQNTGLYSYAIGVQGDLVFPRMLFPFPLKNVNTFSVPKTKFSASYDILNRVQYYRMTSVLASFGYTWNSSRFITHEINPVSLNFVKLTNITAAFNDILNENPYLRVSFQQQFIAGLTYSFTYNQLVQKQRRNSIFFQTNLDMAGNLINSIQRIGGVKDSVKTLLGQPYAQYAKVDGDIRFYKRIRKNSILVFRLFAGMGVPYGNSSQMPFIKQYFSGGPNSLRAFRARSIGPGSYHSDKSYAESYWDQSGNIKLEANIEYRFPIISFLKGAWFVDAGNVWISNDNASLPGGKFGPQWYTEIAAGAGFGLRIDIQYFVIRFDLATPLRNPSKPMGERWVGLARPGDGWDWSYLVLNFAIGYPF